MKPVPNLAWFKQLTAKRQQQLWHWMNGDPENGIKPLSYKEIIAKVKKFWGITLKSTGRLSDFYAWFSMQGDLKEAKTFRDGISEFLAEHPNINLDADTVLKVGQLIFEREAVSKRNSKLFIGLRRLRQKDVDQMIERNRFEMEFCERFLEFYNEETARRIVTDPQTTKNEKIAQLRKHFFADVDAKEQSGSVKLPTKNKPTAAVPKSRKKK